jgi:hypothetical protein
MYTYSLPGPLLTEVTSGAAVSGDVPGIMSLIKLDGVDTATGVFLAARTDATPFSMEMYPGTGHRGYGGEGFYAFEAGPSIVVGAAASGTPHFVGNLTSSGHIGRFGFGAAGGTWFAGAVEAENRVLAAFNCAGAATCTRPEVLLPVPAASDPLLSIDAIDAGRYVLTYVGNQDGAQFLVFILYDPVAQSTLGVAALPLAIGVATDLDIGVHEDRGNITIAFGAANAANLVTGAVRICE